jgi:outer membrane lipoprotein SlyB
METADNKLERLLNRRSGILYPVLLVAAIALIVFSALGIATMLGWLPSARSVEQPVLPATGTAPAAKAPPTAGAAAQAPSARPAPARQRTAGAPAACAECGVVESIRVVELQGEGSGLGAIGGAVVGGILGNQVGRGSGRTAATVVGAGAGAYAGHEIEKNVNKSVRYQVQVRMDDGTYRTFHQPTQPALAVGQRVRVTGQGVVAEG